MLIDWLKKKFGCHVCEELTRWEVRLSCGRYGTGPEFTERWQERQCTICGKIQQTLLEYGGPTSEQMERCREKKDEK